MGQKSQSTGFGDILVGFIALILAFPYFILVHLNLPRMHWPFHLDRIILFVIILLLLVVVLRYLKPLIIIALVGTLSWLIYGSITGRYGFENLVRDSKAMAYSLKNNMNAEQLTFLAPSKLEHEQKVLSSIDADNPAIREFSIKAVNENFRDQQRKDEEFRTIIQGFAIFKKINSNWNYVSDPLTHEYFAKASESVKFLAGDCDDHSILMAACLKTIGATPRLVYTTGHIYPEILVGDVNDLERVNYMINRSLFPNEVEGQEIHYHKDDKGMIWLNLDYTASYPGGKFFAEPVLGILYP